MTEDEFRIEEGPLQHHIAPKEVSDDFKLVSTASCAFHLLDITIYPVKKLAGMSFDRMDEGLRCQIAHSLMEIDRELATIGYILSDYINQIDEDVFGKEESE